MSRSFPPAVTAARPLVPGSPGAASAGCASLTVISRPVKSPRLGRRLEHLVHGETPLPPERQVVQFLDKLGPTGRGPGRHHCLRWKFGSLSPARVVAR